MLGEFSLPGRLQRLRRNHRPQLRRELLLDLGEPSLPGQLDDGQGRRNGRGLHEFDAFLRLVACRFLRV